MTAALFAIAALFIFGGIRGVYLRRKGAEKWKGKLAIVAIVLCFIVSSFFFMMGFGSTLPTPSQSGQTLAVSQSTKPALTQKQKPSSQPASGLTQQQLQAKQEAKKAVDDFNHVDQQLSSLVTSYGKELQGIGNGEIDPATGYSDLNELDSESLDLFSAINNLNEPSRYDQAKNDILTAAAYVQDSIKNSKAYMDSQKISQLSTAQDDIKNAVASANQAMVEVVIQAEKDGYNIPTGNNSKQ